MAIIASALERIKSSPLECLGGAARVNQCFSDIGHLWRDRVLDPANTLALFVLQILHGNTAISHLRLISKISCADASYCDARMRLPVAGVAAVVEELSCDAARYSEDDSTWMGRRVLMADCTGTTAPDTPPSQKVWPQPSEQKKGCGFPAIKLLTLMHVASGMIRHLTMMSLHVHEMSQLAGPHGTLQRGDVVLADRAFCSFGHLALLAGMSVDAVFRMHQKQIVDFTPGRKHRGKSKKKYTRGMPGSRFVRKLGDEDQIVEWTRPVHRPAWMTEAQFLAQPQVLQIRELRYRITANGMRSREVMVATTLLDPMRYPKRELARLYKLRWEIETNFDHLKTTMKMDHLKCKTPEGVMKELMVFALVYNLIRTAMVQAAKRQGIADANRISFIDALRWLCTVLTAPSAGEMPLLIVNPVRPGRYHPRIRKRRMKAYELMNKPRHEYAIPGAEEVDQSYN